MHEWLGAQAASEYCHYDPATRRFHLDPAQVACLADESHPAFVAGGMAVASSMHKDEDAVPSASVGGAGIGWHEHHHDLFSEPSGSSGPAYVSQLVSIVDPGAGRRRGQARTPAAGSPTWPAATARPPWSWPGPTRTATIIGFDYHEASIEAGPPAAAEAGLADRVRFEVATGRHLPGLRTTTWSASSTPSTTWATRRGGPPHPRRPRPRRHVAPGRAPGR